MRGFRELDPLTITAYYLCAVGTVMFCMHPVIIILSLFGSVALFITIDTKHKAGIHISFFMLFIVLAVINPIWYHNGVTVLFVVNDDPITLEATLYGIFAACMMISVLYRFRTFSMIMTADKLMRVFGKLSPKAALILSMALRYVPLMRHQNNRIRNTQKALGIYRGDNVADTLKGETRIFSIMATWALETGIITADSMEARGYGSHRRTSFSVYHFTASDAVFLSVTLILTVIIVIAAASGETSYTFYPALSSLSDSALAAAAYISYGILSFLPAMLEWKEAIRLKCLISKI